MSELQRNSGMRSIDMPGARSLRIVTIDVDRTGGRRDPQKQQTEPVEVDVRPGVVERPRERRVVEPAGVRCRADDEARVDEDPREQEHVVAEAVESRKCELARADHERREIEAEAGQHRLDEQEHHRHAVHREQLVVCLGREQAGLGPRELRAHDRGLDTAQREEHEGGDDVAHPELLVVDRREPGNDAARRMPITR